MPANQSSPLANQESPISKPGYQLTKLGWLPEEWEVVRLEEAVKFRNGKGHEKNIDEDGDYILVNSRFVSTQGQLVKSTNLNLVPLFKDEFVMVMSDVPNGKAIARCFYINTDNRYTLNQRIGGFTARNHCNSKYLFYVVNRNRFYLKFDDGLGQTNLRKKQVLDCPIPLPPLPEQTRIANLLTTWDRAITTTQQLLDALETRKRGLMQQLLTGEVRLPGFVGEWEEDSIENIFNYLKTNSLSRTKLTYKEQVNPVYNIHYGDIHTGKVDTHFTVDRTTTPSIKTSELPTTGDLLRAGDIVMADASEDYEGVASAIEVVEQSKSVVGGLHTFCLRPTKQRIAIGFGGYLFQNEKVRNAIRRIATGASVIGISKRYFSKILISLPSVKEQTAIATILTAADREITLHREKLESLKTQKRGLMQLLLTGQKRLSV